eukprot:10401682-Ditylum_brightwellii.AAC.1
MYSQEIFNHVAAATHPYFCQYEGNIDDDLERFIQDQLNEDQVKMSSEARNILNNGSKKSMKK